MTLNIVKVGGSLSQEPKALQVLCQKLSLIANKHRILIVPGGGKFADCVREVDKQFSLSAVTAHRMAVLGMDQYGLLLANLIPNSIVIDQIEETKNITTHLGIFLPSKFIAATIELPNSWEVTSDSIAAYIAKKLDTEKLLLLKDVNGIFTDNPKTNAHAKLFEHITIKKLSDMKNNTCVDPYLPTLLSTLKIDCHIINGLYPNRVEAALNRQKTTGTTISSEHFEKQK